MTGHTDLIHNTSNCTGYDMVMTSFKHFIRLYLRSILISLWSIQDGTSDIIGHTGHLSTAICDPQHLIGCLVIQGKVEPV